jgi:membrane protease YdiL (CAAX protease family)
MNNIEPQMNKRSDNRAIAMFIALAIGLSLFYWGLFILHDWGFLPFDPASDAMGVLRGYGPTVAALATAAFIYGRQGLRELWATISMWRISPRLLALAILGPLFVSVVLLLIAKLAGVDLTPNAESEPILKLILVFLFFAIADGPIGEEIGWRGFLLPKLLSAHGAIFASTLLGVVWFAWHIPLYAATGKMELEPIFLVSYLLNNVAFSFIHTWFFLRSGGSALLSIVLHTAGNYAVFLAVTFFPSIEKSLLTQPIYVGILVITAIFAGISMWRNPAYGRRAKAVG